ncbi:MAG TPA: GH92 family glycosyl hydrolase [Saprospiraceae bacterium]|nr:GH92 family glycosyl hydrolase [Saprospiraceae bacterium]
MTSKAKSGLPITTVKTIVLLGYVLFVLSCQNEALLPAAHTPPINYVDPYIGTDGHGHVFLGANVPFGAVQVGPTNFTRGWDWCSGYHYSDSVMIGFAQTHLSGTGIGDLGDVMLMPYTGPLQTSPGSTEAPFSGYASYYDHEQEQAEPGYYKVTLQTHDIDVQLTASQRVGFHRYTFPKATAAHIAVDLAQGVGWDDATEGYLRKVDDQTLVGHRYSTGWAKDQRVFFAVRLSKPMKSLQLIQNDSLVAGDSLKAQYLRAMTNFDTETGEVIMAKVGISPVSSANALANIEAEIPHWDFEKAKEAAQEKWDQELSKVQITQAPETVKRTYYTAFYHLMFFPALFNDHNGDYRGTDKQVYRGADFDNYTIFSLWDTYRAAHPFFTLTQPERTNDFIRSMLAIHEQQGRLPVWHLAGNETNTMVGYHAIPPLVDAYFKGIRDYDVEQMYQALRTTALETDDGMGLKYVNEMGFVPSDKIKDAPVSMGQEYAIDDWAIAQMAKDLGKEKDYQLFMERSKYYENYFDPEIKFFRGKLSNGEWREPFDPYHIVHMASDFTEGNAWQYLWLAPHDVEGLVALQGGEAPFVSKLDSLFSISSNLNEGASADISGMIGQYAHGNEPSHHTTYLYAYVGQQYKTADKVRYIMDSLYTDQPDGLCGNEDCGQMSAWYLFSALGFYPVNPMNSAYIFGSPIVQEARLPLPNGNTFTVKSNASPQNLYIQSVRLNDESYSAAYITHHQIMQGGTLTFELGPQPNPDFGKAPEDRPASRMYK